MKEIEDLMKKGNVAVIEQENGAVIIETGLRIENIMGTRYFAGNVCRTFYAKGITQ